MWASATNLIAAATEKAVDTGNPVVVAVISAASTVAVALGVQWLVNQGKSRPDVTELGRSGLEIVPEMGDKVLEALSRVQELTEAVSAARTEAAEAKTEAAGAKAEAAAARADASAVRLELAAAKHEAQALRAENAELRRENADLRGRR